MDIEALKKELKASPESLTARIKGLNDLTNDLNAYLKMYCMESIKELKDELESTKNNHSTKIQSLEDELQKREEDFEAKLTEQQAEHEKQRGDLSGKIETMKNEYISEKTKMEQNHLEQIFQIKQDLEKHEGQTSSVEEEL